MQILGVSVEVTGSKIEVVVKRVDVLKETEKMYKLVSYSGLVFDCLYNISKDKLNKVTINKNFITSVRATIWVLDKGLNEQVYINSLKQKIEKELVDRKELLKSMCLNLVK